MVLLKNIIKIFQNIIFLFLKCLRNLTTDGAYED